MTFHLALWQRWFILSVSLIFAVRAGASTVEEWYYPGATRRLRQAILGKDFLIYRVRVFAKSITPYVVGTPALVLAFALGHRAEVTADPTSKVLVYIAAFLLGYEVLYMAAVYTFKRTQLGLLNG